MALTINDQEYSDLARSSSKTLLQRKYGQAGRLSHSKFTRIITEKITIERSSTMQVTSITISRTKQVRQYEPERIEIVVALNEGDTVSGAIASARATIAAHFGETPSADEVQQAQATLDKAHAPRFS